MTKKIASFSGRALAFCLGAILHGAPAAPPQVPDTPPLPAKTFKTKLAPGYTIPIVDIPHRRERSAQVGPQ